MDKDKERGRRLTREELTKKLSKITTFSKFFTLLKPSQYIVAKIIKALKIVNRNLAFDSFCL